MVTQTVDKRSVSMPATVAQAVDDRVGSRGFSAYVSEATAQRLRRDSARELLTDIEAIHGITDNGEVAQLRALFG